MRLRPLASTLRPLLLILAILFAGAGLSGVASAQSAMPRYIELQRDVDFWIRVYTEISTRQGFVHDARNLAVVYGVAAHRAAPPGSDPRRDAITAARDRWSAALRAAADALTAGQPLQGDAAWVFKVWRDALGRDPDAGMLTAALADVRFQLGQADRFRAGVERSGAWREHIAAVLAAAQLPPELIALPHVESSFDPTAYSKVGAAGMWQFMPGTARLYMRVDGAVDERMDPFRATEAAAQLLANNHRLLGSWPLTLTAYNHGAAGMRRARDAMGTDDFAVIARRYRGPAFGFASRNFYPSFLAALTIDQDPARYFPGVQRAAPLRPVEIALPTAVAAAELGRLLDLPQPVLRELNPARRPAVWNGARPVPAGYRLRLPTGSPWTPERLAAVLRVTPSAPGAAGATASDTAAP
ncbi:MAG: lytic transglycosylase domain-containing protein [Gammaproteobacteria bacterium]